MQSAKCPECEKEVMSFSMFFRRAEPNKKFQCKNCGTELKRSNWVWFLIFVAMTILGISIIFINFQEWTLAAKLISIVFLFVACIIIIKFIGWKFISWKRVESA